MRERNLLNRIPYVPACQRGQPASVVYVPTCLHASIVYVLTCQKRASCSFLRANVPINVPTCYTACHCFTWRANVPNDVLNFELGVPTYQKACQFFRHSSYEMLSEISILYYYIKNYTFYDILLHSTNSTFYHSYTNHMYMYRK